MADLRAYVSEFLGTFMLVFTVGCSVLSGRAMFGGIAVGSVLAVTIYALAPISGAHFNPAVSISLGLLKKLEGGWPAVAMYCAIQVVAGIAASFCYGALSLDSIVLKPVEEYGWVSALVCEALYTCMLCFVVLNVSATEVNAERQFYGIAIGFAVIAGAYGAGAVSGGCFNPALAIAVDVGSLRFKWCVPYAVAEFIGAAVAVELFCLVRPEDFEGAAGEDYPLPGPDLKAALISEFLGAYFLVLTVGLNASASSPAAVFSNAASLVSMMFAVGDVSDAHFNPAVTMAVYAARKMRLKTSLAYSAAHMVAAGAAALTYVAITGKSFDLLPMPGWSWAGVAVAETCFTFLLSFVALCVAYSSTNYLPEFSGLAIAFCVVAGGSAANSISGGSLNPAVSFGVVFGGRCAAIDQALLYTFFELVGGILAAAVFTFVEDELQLLKL